ncbi:MAG: hypothetical protein RCG15_05690 [Candidatus Rickettsia vulgarisii]
MLTGGVINSKNKDITGRISTVTIPYYVAPNLLRQGLSDVSFEAGFQRKHYGIKNNKYKDLVINYNYMYGLTDKLTSGVYFESLRHRNTIGINNNVQISNYGVISVGFANNIHQVKNSQKLMLAYSYQDPIFNFYVSMNKNSHNYLDIYSEGYHRSSRMHYQASMGFTDGILGSISINFLSFDHKHHHKYHHRHHHFTNENNFSKCHNILSATYSRNIIKNGFLNFTMGSDLRKANKHNFACLSLGMSLDNKVIALSNSCQNRVKQLSISSNNSNGLTGWRYNANLIKSKTNDYNIQVNRDGGKVSNNLYLYKYGELGLQGSIIATNNKLFLTRAVNDSFALVKVGELKDMPVYNNNLLVGYTDKNGEILVPNIIP